MSGRPGNIRPAAPIDSPGQPYIYSSPPRRRGPVPAALLKRENGLNFEGTHKLQTDAESAWNLLNDPEVLSRCTPGVVKLIPIEGEKYEAVFDIKLGPINSGFEGTIEVTDKVAPQSYRLVVEVDGRIGTVTAEGSFDIKPDGDASVVSFVGKGRMTGVLARLGQRVMSGVARLFTAQFFQALEKEIA